MMNPVLNRLLHALVSLSCDFRVRFHDTALTTEQAAGFVAGDPTGAPVRKLPPPSGSHPS